MNQGKRSRLIEALRLCALPYPEQAGALPEFVFVPDEVVGEFDEAYRSLTRLELRHIGSSVEQLDRLFREMSDAIDREWVWSTEAMRKDPRWEQVRALAAETLGRLGEPLKRPTFPNSIWVGKSSTGEVVEVRGDAVPVRQDDDPGDD